jgi:predicted phage terminase large subunit-like protein
VKPTELSRKIATLSNKVFADSLNDMKPSERSLATRMRRLMSLEVFARECFPDLCRLPFSPLHAHLLERRRVKTAEPLERRAGALDVVLAPRGAAKTTLVSLIFPLHALLFGHDRYIVLISATLRQAARRIANLRAALDEDGPLWREFAPADSRRRRRWLRRCTAHALELDAGRIEAFSAGAELRGISHGPWRPTWIILDDVERGDRVRQARHRDALADWFAETVENLGDRYTNIDVIGTLLHPDALPARLARRPDVVACRFASILAEARDQALWERWRGLFHDLSDPDRLAHARAFFEERREAMLAGSVVLWPEKEDYYALQVMRETRGRAAFDKEKQNQPALAQAGLFGRERLRWFRLDQGRLIRLAFQPTGEAGGKESGAGTPLDTLRRFGFLDPALGRDGGDFAAIATVGLDGDGYLYVLDVWLGRAAPSEQLTRLFDLHADWDYEAFGIETNAFQHLLLEPLEAERERRRAAGRPWDLPVEERRHRGSKADRILALEPLVEAGRLLFNEALDRVFLGQLEDFPEGRHDDGPDALAAAVELARRAAPRTVIPLRRPRQAGGGMRQF